MPRGRPKGSTGLATLRKKSWVNKILPPAKEKEMWDRFLASEDEEIAHKTFIRLIEYKQGKPIQPVAGDADGSPVKIEFRGL
jgi:hypothetical protein